MRGWLRRRKSESMADPEVPTTSPPPPHRSSSMTGGSPLAVFEPVCDRVVVLDCETTGVYTTDRVVEVAAVTLDLAGQVIDEWETLVNPCRDVGPTWLHGVTADMVADAPTFDQIAEELAARVHESLVCAHNLPFDVRMLTAEYEAAGVAVSLAGVDTLALVGGRLAVACERYGVVLDGAHRALHDARACAQLLLHVAAHASVPTSASIVHSPTSATGKSRRRVRPVGSAVVEAPPSKLGMGRETRSQRCECCPAVLPRRSRSSDGRPPPRRSRDRRAFGACEWPWPERSADGDGASALAR